MWLVISFHRRRTVGHLGAARVRGRWLRLRSSGGAPWPARLCRDSVVRRRREDADHSILWETYFY